MDLDGALAWLDERLEIAGIPRTGDADPVHVRPWATVLRVPTRDGVLWLKAAGPGTAFEAGLYELLERVAPDSVLRPLAVDAARGWLLLPDGGLSLGTRLDGSDLARAMEQAMAQYAELQRALAPHVRRVLGLGVADMRPAALPGRFDEALVAVRAHVESSGGTPNDLATLRRLEGSRDRVAEWSQRLVEAPGAASVDHNDLHPWNVLTGAGGQARFYDWGDAVVAHPFASMLVPLAMAARNGQSVKRLRDAYLARFSDLAPQAELVEALELACRVGKIARALTWQRAVGALGPADVDPEWARAPFETLASLLDDSYVGGW